MYLRIRHFLSPGEECKTTIDLTKIIGVSKLQLKRNYSSYRPEGYYIKFDFGELSYFERFEKLEDMNKRFNFIEGLLKSENKIIY